MSPGWQLKRVSKDEKARAERRDAIPAAPSRWRAVRTGEDTETVRFLTKRTAKRVAKPKGATKNATRRKHGRR